MRQKLITSLGIILVPLVIILLSADIVISNEKVHLKLLQQYEVYEQINASRETVDAQATNILAYLQDEEPLQPLLLNEKEVRHMADVKTLFTRGYQLLAISILLLSTSLLVSNQKKRIILWGIILTIVVVSLFTLSNFTNIFYNFHVLFFNNDLWMLNPQTDNLIKMYPEEIFQAFAYRIGMIVTGITISSLAISLYNSKKKEKLWQKA